MTDDNEELLGQLVVIGGRLLQGDRFQLHSFMGYYQMDEITVKVIEKLTREMTSWRSIHLFVSQKVGDYPSAMSFAAESTMSFDYVETSLEQRMYDLKSFANKKLALRIQMYHDGKEASAVVWDPRKIESQEYVTFGGTSFGREFNSPDTERPKPLYYFYVGKMPLYEALKSAEHAGSGRLGDYQTEIYKFPDRVVDALKGTMEYHLDRASGMPVQIVFWPSPEKRKWVWTADEFAEIQGYRFPIKSTFRDVSHGDETLSLIWTVEKLNYNESYDAAMFQAVPDPGVKILGKRPKSLVASSRTPSTKPAVVERTTPANSQTVDVAPVIAKESDWSGVLQVSSIALGCALLVAGIALKRRFS